MERTIQVSLDRLLAPSAPRSATAQQIITDKSQSEIEETLAHEEEVELLREEILGLKEQERIVLSLYYFEELKLHEIATVMGVTESRISQIRSKAIRTLRSRMAHLRGWRAG